MRQRIRDTLTALENEGVLASDLRAIVESRLDAALSAPVDRSSRVIAIVAAFGGVLVGFGILSLIAFNWEALDKVAKLALIFAIWLGFHAAGFWLAEPAPAGGSASRGRSPRIGRALTVVGVLCFGGAIALVAQIYHLTAEYPNAVLLWWLLNVPIALWTGSRAVQFVVTTLFLIWAYWHANVWLDHGGHLSFREGMAANALLTLGLAALLGGLALNVRPTRHSRFAAAWRALALLLAFGGAYLLSFREAWEQSSDSFFGDAGRSIDLRAFVPFAIVAALAVLLSIVHAQQSRERTLVLGPLGMVAVGVFLGLAAHLVPRAVPVCANLLLLAAVVALVVRGVRLGRPGEINFAVFVFVVLVITRYFEYFWDRLEGAYAFLVTGALLLGLCTILERRRRTWIARTAERVA